MRLTPEKAPPGMSPSPRIDGRVINCFGATKDRETNHMDELKGFGRGKSAPLVISLLEIPTPVDEQGNESDYEVGHH